MKCRYCDQEIHPKRLAAVPDTEYCAKCQEGYEKRYPRDLHSSAFAVGAEPDDVTRFREEMANG